MNEANGLNEVVFTSASILDLLLKIDELQDYTIGITETLDGNLQLQVGNSIYMINAEDCTTIRVDDEIVGEIENQTEEAYAELVESVSENFDESAFYESEILDDEVVEGSIIKDIAKSLTLGGMIRFATKHLLK